LLIAKIKLSLRQRPKGEDKRKMVVHSLKLEEVEKEFQVKILNMFEVLQDKDVEDVEEYWMEYRDALKETGKEVLGCVRS
jgi:HSP90 family molecular chaperone